MSEDYFSNRIHKSEWEEAHVLNYFFPHNADCPLIKDNQKKKFSSSDISL
jgi:hypothetical protein